MGGRGSGKTRAGAEWIADGIRDGRLMRPALIAATHDEARAVMIEGPSGLLGVSPGAVYEPSNRRVIWPSGAVARVLSAEEPDSIRGFQFDAAWCDEFCKWRDAQKALDIALLALRLGEDPRMMVTTTPRNMAPLKRLLALPDTVVTRASTADNEDNLADGFVADMQARYAGTRLGRQEMDGDLIEDNDAALWQRDWIEKSRLRTAPQLQCIVVGVDPPAGLRGDECGIVVAGTDANGQGYVLADRSAAGLTPAQWSARVIAAYEEFKADAIVAEANIGGEMVRDVLTRSLRNAPVKLVHATRDKQTRATPFAHLYERGQVHHVGVFAELEDQMCQYDGPSGNYGPSPDRVDALVWALAHLMPAFATEPKVRSLA